MKDDLINTFLLTANEAEAFCKAFELKSYSKGSAFLGFGQQCNQIGFLEKGLLKCSLLSNGKSVVDDFVFEGQFVASYYSFLKKEPSNKEIVCLKDSRIHVISRDRLERLGHTHPFIEQMAKQVSEHLFIKTSEKLQDLQLLNAEERYLKLLQTNPAALQQIPQYEIASYLNVSPETVSRIRSKLAIAS